MKQQLIILLYAFMARKMDKYETKLQIQQWYKRTMHHDQVKIYPFGCKEVIQKSMNVINFINKPSGEWIKII